MNHVEKSQNKPFHKKIILVLIGIIFALIAIYLLFVTNQQSKPEDTISNFFNTYNQGEYQKMENFVDPNNPADVMDDIDFNEMPSDAQIHVVSFGDKDYGRKDEVSMKVELKATSKKLDFENVIEVTIDLFKWKNKWYIEDIY